MVTIARVDSGSAADKAGILAGDRLISIDGHPVKDVLDYRFFLTEERIRMMLLRGKESYEVTIRKGRYDDIGLDFETFLMDQKRRCANRCIFCFIDQNPCGMRETVYFKDDDTRLSFLMGNYVTLTNVSREELDRIVTMRLSPVNVSVHTTNPSLRIKMIGNPKADRILDQLQVLKDGGIDLNCQIVCCRGINDGAELIRTVKDLERFYPALQSIAVVPAGLTRHREGLTPIEPFDPASAKAVIDTVEALGKEYREKYGVRLVYAADEFYLSASLPMPEEEDYDGYPQLDNGVGLIRSAREEILSELEWRWEEGGWKSLPQKETEITLATGKAAEGFMKEIAEAISRKLPCLKFRIAVIPNRFFGETVTVAGLICGGDLIREIKPLKPKLLWIPAVSLRYERDKFLDDTEFSQLEAELGCPVTYVENGVSILDQVETILQS